MTSYSQSLNARALVLSLALHCGVFFLLHLASIQWSSPFPTTSPGTNLTNISIADFNSSSQASNAPASKAKKPAAIAKNPVQPQTIKMEMSQEVLGDSEGTSPATSTANNASGGSGNGSQTGTPYSSYLLTTLPKVLQEVKADFPPEAKKLGLTGKVILSVIINSDGSVRSARVVKPAGYGFDKRAEEAILKFRFSPAIANGNPVATEIKYTYVFELR